MSDVDDSSRGFIDVRPEPLRYMHTHVASLTVHDMIPRAVPMGSRVLDVGCGVGELAHCIATTRQAQVTGVEPNAERARAALERGITVHQGHLDDAVIQRLGVFDVVVLADVLEHLADPMAMLELCHRVMSPHGKLLLSVPNIAHFSVRWELLMGRFNYEPWGIMDATHLRWFTATTLQRLLAASGYRVVTMQTTLNTYLQFFDRHLPWCWMNHSVRRAVLKSARRVAPKLVGVQFVVEARPIYQPPAITA